MREGACVGLAQALYLLEFVGGSRRCLSGHHAVDIWVSESVAPLGVVKVVTTPDVDKSRP
jgi:hypothetical protein